MILLRKLEAFNNTTLLAPSIGEMFYQSILIAKLRAPAPNKTRLSMSAIDETSNQSISAT